MEIRTSTEHDIPGIVNLLKTSLGEKLMPKSEAYWRWKHINNPFGSSKVLVAIEKEAIIGVRAFMRWTWVGNGKVYNAVRAVDTATHPDHQGKGIFKKLTMKLVEDCKRDGFDFIFNTPNNQSRPGYLKMGWEPAGKFPISFRIDQPFGLLLNVFRQNRFEPLLPARFCFPKNNALSIATEQKAHLIHTDWSEQYIRWRYEEVPVAEYGTLYLDDAVGFLVFRIKPGRFGVELRICDIFAETKSVFLALIKELHNVYNKFHYSTLSGKEIPLPGLSKQLAIGPLVTVRNLNLRSIESLTNFHEWSPSLGDLELF